MKLIRDFVPVGQGLFCIETYEIGNNSVRIVYDCGTITNKNNNLIGKRINQYLNNVSGKDMAIDAVFVSHFHEDHINGIAIILQNYDVKRIVYPYIYYHRELFNIIIRERLSEYACELWEAIYNDNMYFDNRVALIPVGDARINHERRVESGDDLCKSYIPLGSSYERESLWCLIPYNHECEIGLSKLKKELKTILKEKEGKEFSDSEIDKFISDVEKDTEALNNNIRDALKKVNSDMNLNTLALYSGPSRDSKICYRNNDNIVIRPGCLYTGDLGLKGKDYWGEFIKVYGKFRDKVGCVQIPHHGSSYSFNDKLLLLGSNCDYIISAGKKNRYSHPNGVVLLEFARRHIIPRLVTEEDESKIEYTIESITDKKESYVPKPIDTSDVELPEEIIELFETVVHNVHDVWARGRSKEGWTYGEVKDEVKKTTPFLVPYEDLPESEKEYDRNTAMETLKMVMQLGFDIVKREENNDSEN